MVERKLEITKKLEDLAEIGELDRTIAILNLPDARLCTHGCEGCITQDMRARLGERLSDQKIKEIMDYFTSYYGTKFITVNGRGDPFHPELKEATLEKVRYAYSKGVISYVFTAGDNLDDEVCRTLAGCGANIMISLYGNRFIQPEFFGEAQYYGKEGLIAANLRRLIRTYRQHADQPEEGNSRIGMNYVVSGRDLADGGAKAKALKQAADDNGLFFIVNTNFQKHPDNLTQRRLEQLAYEHSDFHLRHSTAVNGQCQMGAGSSATVDYDGMLLRCPYMNNNGNSNEGDGAFQDLSVDRIKEVLGKYMKDRSYPCVMRKHQK